MQCPTKTPCGRAPVATLLCGKMLDAASRRDAQLLQDMIFGLPTIGAMTCSKRWFLLQDTPMADLESRAWEFSKKVDKKFMRAEISDNAEKIWEVTMEDVREKLTFGPIFDEEVFEILGISQWVPTKVGVGSEEQGQKS